MHGVSSKNVGLSLQEAYSVAIGQYCFARPTLSASQFSPHYCNNFLISPIHGVKTHFEKWFVRLSAGRSASRILLRSENSFNSLSPGQTRPIKIPLIGGGPHWNHRSLCISNIFRQLILPCLLSGRRENMRTVRGARGPLSCHGQSSGPIRRYGGTLALLTPTTWEQN